MKGSAKNKRHTSNITFVIFTYNEEKRITYPVKSFLPYGEVIIFDNYSSDRTREIAKSLGAKVVLHRRKQYVENKKDASFIFNFIKTDWIFWGFADEMVPKKCLELYTKISSDSKYKVVIQKRKTLLFNYKSEFLPCYVVIKLFRKDSLDFTDNAIHHMGKFAFHVKQEDVLYLPPIDEYSVYHFSKYTTELATSNLNIYSSDHARSISKKFLTLRIIFIPIVDFFTHFLFEGGVKYGIKGFIVSMQYAFYSFLVLAKAYEYQNNINLASIEKNFAKGMETLLTSSPQSTPIQKLIAFFKISIISNLHKYYKFKNRLQSMKSYFSQFQPNNDKNRVQENE